MGDVLSVTPIWPHVELSCKQSSVSFGQCSKGVPNDPQYVFDACTEASVRHIPCKQTVLLIKLGSCVPQMLEHHLKILWEHETLRASREFVQIS